MVFFTCNHCGESLKKCAVEKHYNFKCRGAIPFLTCIDCLKDYRENEYIKHTSCITENEKYSAKDYVPKEKNTGKKKQDCWLEVVRSILSSNPNEIEPSIRAAFQKLMNYDNVPRKKVKFQNFVSNCLKLNAYQAEKVWLVLEKALEKYNAIRAQPKSQKPIEVDVNKKMNDMDKNTEENIAVETNEIQKIKKKKNSNQDPEQLNLVETVTEAKKEKKLKKKKSKNVDVNNTINDDIQEPPEKKPKTDENKKKGSKDENKFIKNLDCDNFNGGDVSNVINSKKDHNLVAETNGLKSDNLNTISSDIVEMEVDEKNITKKKKKKKSKEIEETTNFSDSIKDTNFIDTNNSISVNLNENQTGFDWNTIIFNVIGNKKEINIQTLKEQVLSEYQKFHQISEITRKVEKTFKKKITKSGLSIVNDVVKVAV